MASDGPTLGRAIKEARERLGMTQAQLARALEVQQNVVARLEDGGRPNPSLSTIIAISQALGISIDALVADAGLANPPAGARALSARLLEAGRVARLARQQLAALDQTLAEFDPKRPVKRRRPKPTRTRRP
jgi:transcriptional regulator with XRE-family HTH domain